MTNTTTGGPSLDHFDARTKLRPFQRALVKDGLDFFDETRGKGGRRLYAAPTGTGKGSAQLALHHELIVHGVDSWILTPSLEVLRGFLERCGAGSLTGVSEDALAELGMDVRITTPTRFRNRILKGEQFTPDVVIYDEVHHAITNNEVSGTLFAVAPYACWLGFTATPYRGSPASTKQLRDDWGEPILVFTIPEAAEAGYCDVPHFEVVPLVDDDTITVRNGEFVVKAATKETGSRIKALAILVHSYQDPNSEPATFSVPTAITVPSSEIAGMLVEELDERGVEARWIHQATKAQDRQKAYDRCKAGKCVLVSIRVLAEGIDLPWLRRLIDARPTLSPVAWVQQIGRIMRPGDVKPHYVCTNRNLERHAYLLDGAVPRSAVAQAQEAFEAPSKRTGARAIGLEALRKFKAIQLPLLGGMTGHLYALYSVETKAMGDQVVSEYVILLHPCEPDPFVAVRENRRSGEATQYGKWARCETPEVLHGFATSKHTRKCSDKQKAWWNRRAAHHGLDPSKVDEITGRQFSALPVLSDTGYRFTGDV